MCLPTAPKLPFSCDVETKMQKQDSAVYAFHNKSLYLNDKVGHVGALQNNLASVDEIYPPPLWVKLHGFIFWPHGDSGTGLELALAINTIMTYYHLVKPLW